MGGYLIYGLYLALLFLLMVISSVLTAIERCFLWNQVRLIKDRWVVLFLYFVVVVIVVVKRIRGVWGEG